MDGWIDRQMDRQMDGDNGPWTWMPFTGGLTAQVGWFGPTVGGHPAISLHCSNEPGELSHWLSSR